MWEMSISCVAVFRLPLRRESFLRKFHFILPKFDFILPKFYFGPPWKMFLSHVEIGTMPCRDARSVRPFPLKPRTLECAESK